MLANGGWDLIRRLKGSQKQHAVHTSGKMYSSTGVYEDKEIEIIVDTQQHIVFGNTTQTLIRHRQFF